MTMLYSDTATATVAYYATAALFTAITLIASYRLFAHPLRAYPGPLAAKLTQFYTGRYVLILRLHLVIWELHRTYGPVIRLGPNALVFNTATALRDIYQNDRIRKSPNYQLVVKNNVYSVFHAIDPEIHRQKRRMIGQVISDRAMRSFEPVMAPEIDIFLKHIKQASQSSTHVNLTPMAKFLSLDIAGQLTFGYGLNMQTSKSNRFMIQAIQAANFMGNLFLHMPFFSKIKYLEPITNRLFADGRSNFLALVDSISKERAALDKNAKPDFYSYVADEIGAKGMENHEGVFWNEALFLLTAGGDTVATLLPATFFYLVRNPRVYAKLVHEIRTTFAHGHEIQGGPQLAGCVYLRACIDEALRMSPPGPTTLWRVQDPNDKQPLFIDGHLVPRGTTFGVNIYSLHHNEDYFPSPFEYRPERWLWSSNSIDEAARKRALEAFTAFGVGSRQCAGKPMAYLEASLVLAKTIWYYDFESAPGELGQVGGGRVGAKHGRDRPDEFQLHDMFVSLHDGPYLVFRSRRGAE
ncbi:cytochrome P450 [Rhypophila decipiens]|uniref:Cytochrome P450 n=1 Tax=Rhypophila decipiens TaxID=261697 RepID=A0AAN7B6M4_9PEZI|nr:cytochrome P450 [Rhypophila decipiens]